MKIQDVMKKIDEADLTPAEANFFLAYLIGFLGDDKQDYDMEMLIKGFEGALKRINARNTEEERV